VADVCIAVGLRSVGSFTTSFGRAFGLSPTAYRAAHPPAVQRVPVPTCVLLAWARPTSAAFEKTTGPAGASVTVDRPRRERRTTC
jgi:AraC-like DNA-binding protein